MPINNPPLREVISSDSPSWSAWFTQVMTALLGWKKTYTGYKVHDFGLIAAHTESTTTLTVTGARIDGYPNVIVTPSVDTAGMVFKGVVTSSDTVTIYALNTTAAGIDPAQAVFRAIVFQQ